MAQLWFDEWARTMQANVKIDEDERNEDYEEIVVRRSIVCTRQDMVLLVSYIACQCKQLRTISRFCFCILLALIVIAVKI